MKYLTKHIRPTLLISVSTLTASLAMAAFLNNAYAAGTTAGTTVSNQAIISYSVGGVTQDDVESSPTGNNTPGAANGAATTFVVDRKIDLNVTAIDTAYVDISAGYDNDMAATVGYRALTFDVTNESNDTIDIKLAPVDSATPFSTGADNFDGTDYKLYLDDGSNTWDAADTLITSLDDLPADSTNRVFVVADIASYPARVNHDVAAISLVAQAAETDGTAITNDDNGHISPGGTASTVADSAATVQTVFADGAGQSAEDIGYNFTTSAAATQVQEFDGQHSDTSAFRVLAADLTVTKATEVIEDPVNDTTNPKRIPGATVRYEIIVANAVDTTTATNLTIADSLVDEITAGTIEYKPGTIEISNDGGSSWTALTDGDDADSANWNVSNTNHVTATDLSVASGADVRIRFQAIVQ